MNCAPARRRARDRGQQRERARDRQRGLGLVEDVQALTAEAVGGEREERLAVGLLVQRDVAVEREVGRERVLAVDERGDVEEALGAQVVARARLRPALQHGLERAVEHRARNGRQLARALELAAFGREADRLREQLDQRRLAAAVVAREQRDRRAEVERLDALHRGQLVREARAPGHVLDALEPEQVRARAEAADVAALQSLTTIFPTLAPRSRSMKAWGAASTPPSTIVSRNFTRPSATQAPTSRTKSP